MKRLIKVLVVLMVLCLTFSVLAACKDPVTIEISKTELTLEVGASKALTAAASDGSEIAWSSSDESIAIYENGKVKGIAPGTAVISASVGEVSATCTVTVNAPVVVTMGQTTATVDKGQTITLTATASDGGAISWSSQNPEIASVDSNGVVTGIEEGTATIVARKGSATAECVVTVTWTSKPADYEELFNGGEGDASSHPNEFVYWYDQGWVGSSVTAKAYLANGLYHFEWSGSTAQWYGFQIFYYNPDIVPGQFYKLTLTINSDRACTITVNGNPVDLVEGDNHVEVYYVQQETNYTGTELAASLSIQAGVEATNSLVEEAALKLSNVQWTEASQEKLATPTALVIGADKSIQVTDSNGANAAGFAIIFSQDGVVKYQLALNNGDIIDDSVFEDGTYDVAVQARGQGMYESSDVSGILAQYTVANGGIVYTIGFGEEKVAIANPGTYYYWTEFEGVTTAEYDNGTITFGVTNGGNWYSNQLFYKNPALTAGAQYKLTGKIVSDIADEITINGNVITLVEGEQALDITYTEGSGASFSLQAGINGDGEVSIGAIQLVISDLVWTPVNPDPGPGVDPVDPEWSFKSAEIEDRAGVAWLRLHFNFAGYTRAEIEGISWCFDMQNNQNIAGGNWEVYFKGTAPEIAFASDSEFILSYNISELPVGLGYVVHLGTKWNSNNMADDLKPAEAINQDKLIGTINYNLVCFPGSGEGKEYWGCLGLYIEDRSAPSVKVSRTYMAVEDGKAIYTVEGTWANYDEEARNGMYMDLERDKIDYTEGKYTFAFNDDGTFTIKCDVTDIAIDEGVELYAHIYLADGTQVAAPAMGDTAEGQHVTIAGKKYIVEDHWGIACVLWRAHTACDSICPECGLCMDSQCAEEFCAEKCQGHHTCESICPECGKCLDSECTDPACAEKCEGHGVAIDFGEEKVAVANPGTYYYWADNNWCGSVVTVSSATLIDGTAKISYTSTGFCWFGMQIFFEQAGLELDQEYKLTLNIKSDVAGQIKVNGTVVDLVVGDNAIEVYYVEGTIVNGGKAASLSIQMGSDAANTMVGAANIEISNLAWEKTEEPGPGVDPVEPSWAFASAEIEDRAGVAWLKLHIAFEGYTRAEVEALPWCFDVQNNDNIFGGGWGAFFQDAVPEIGFVSDNELTLAYNLSSLPVGRGYVCHLGNAWGSNGLAADLKPTEAIDKTVSIGSINYKLVCFPGSEDGKEYWGCLGLAITEADADAKRIDYTSVTLAVEDGKLLLIYSGTYGSYYADTAALEAQLALDFAYAPNSNGESNNNSLQRYENGWAYIWDAIDAEGNKHYTVVAQDGKVQVKCDISNAPLQLGDVLYGHFLGKNMAVPYEEVTVEFGGFEISIKGRTGNLPDWMNGMSLIYVKAIGAAADPVTNVTSIALVQQDGRVLYVISGTYQGYTAAQFETARTDLLAEYTDGTPAVDRAEGKNVVTVDEEAGTFTIVVDVTDFESTADVKEGHLFPHFHSSVGLAGNVTGNFENGQTITLGNKTFTLQEAYSMPTLKVEVAE